MNARIETTGKTEIRTDVQARIQEVTSRLATMRQIVACRLGAHEVTRTIDQGELQIAAQRRIAERARSTIPALRAAADEAERVCQAVAIEVKAATEAKPAAKRAPRGSRTEVSKVVYGEGGPVQVVMVTYPAYRYDLVVAGEVVHTIKATRAWRTERKALIEQAQAVV